MRRNRLSLVAILGAAGLALAVVLGLGGPATQPRARTPAATVRVRERGPNVAKRAVRVTERVRTRNVAQLAMAIPTSGALLQEGGRSEGAALEGREKEKSGRLKRSKRDRRARARARLKAQRERAEREERERRRAEEKPDEWIDLTEPKAAPRSEEARSERGEERSEPREMEPRPRDPGGEERREERREGQREERKEESPPDDWRA